MDVNATNPLTNTLTQPWWIPYIPVVIGALVALTGVWFTHILSDKRDRIREKEEKLRGMEEVYSRLFPLEVITQRVYSIHCRANRRFNISSHTSGIHIEWQAMSAQTKLVADVELTKAIKELGDACSLIRLRFKNTPELIGLTTAFLHHHVRYRDELLNQNPPEGLSPEEIAAWVGTALDNWFYSLWNQTFSPTFNSLIGNIMADITTERQELEKMRKDRWKFWKL